MRKNFTNRWLSNMLRKLDSFQRIAAWPGGPRMSLRRRTSPVHWMRDRLFLLQRLQPRVVHLQLTNSVRFSYAVTNAAATRAIERHSMLPPMLPRQARETPFQAAAAPAPSLRYEIVKGPTAPLARTVLQSPAGRVSVRRPITPREILRRHSTEAPLTALLRQRSRRVDELPMELPARLVRQPASAPRTMAPQSFSEAAGAVTPSPFPRTHTAAAWPMQPAPAAPVNVEQITDQVLRQLDRRLIASRERMGRI